VLDLVHRGKNVCWPLASALVCACVAASDGRLWGDSPLTIDLGANELVL